MARDRDAEGSMSPEGTSPPGIDDQLNAAGHKIMSMLQHASSLTESRTRGATENAERLSQQLNQLETASKTWKRRSNTIKIGWIALSNGCTEFIRKLKRVFPLRALAQCPWAVTNGF